MRGREQRALDHELALCWKVGIARIFGPSFDDGRGRWIVTLRSDLGRTFQATALTAAGAVKNARTALGYRLIDGDLVYERAAS